MTRPEDAPRLQEWLTATEVSDVLGVSRQTVNQMIKNGEFSTLHLIGLESKPQYLVHADEVHHFRQGRAFPRSPRRGT